MNFKNVKLGGKLAIGFGVLIVISIILGGLAITNMSKITTESEYLAHEYVPEIIVATDLRGASNRAMFEMRGYTYTEDETFLKEAEKEMLLIDEAIEAGKELNSKSEKLKRLGEDLDAAEKAMEKYDDLAAQTIEVNNKLKEDRATMDESAAEYMANCYAYLENQNRLAAQEIRSGKMSSDRLTKITLINDIIDEGNAVRLGNFKSQATRDPEIFQAALDEFPKVHQLLDDIRTYTRLEADLKALDAIDEEAQHYEQAMKDFIANWTKREELAAAQEVAGKELIAACADTEEAGLENTQVVANDAITTLKASNKVMVAGLLFAVIVGVVFAFFLTRIITSGLKKGVVFAKQLAGGDLTATIDLDQKDEVGQLAQALKDMGAKLREIVSSILSGADNIASASQQMSGTSQSLSEGASEQASSVEEVSSSMEEMAANIQNNLDNAQQTEKIASTSAQGIKESSDATNTAVSSMKDIAERIKIINEIASQTNILALNAAVEAARAGEHGKGFAVVAAEVRKLAERSKLAADEIDELSKSGVDTAEQAGEKLAAIVPDIENTAKLVQEIAASSSEQNSGADQINDAMQQLNQVTQQNAAASEEMASGAEELASQAEQLKETVLYFNLGDQRSFSKKSIHQPKLIKEDVQSGGNGHHKEESADAVGSEVDDLIDMI